MPMRVIILAGGRGSRLVNNQVNIPKPAYPIAGKPLIWHVMQRYAAFGFSDFLVALGHRMSEVRECLESAPCFAPNARSTQAQWKIATINTGEASSSGERIRQALAQNGEQTCMLTWCDGVADINLEALLSFHRQHGRLATMTVVHPPARFGHVDLEDGRVTGFYEKHAPMEGWINAAYFVLEPGVAAYLEGENAAWETGALVELAKRGELMAYAHEGFWHCVDFSADADTLEELCAQGSTPWIATNHLPDCNVFAAQ